jgi:hypothetical protein
VRCDHSRSVVIRSVCGWALRLVLAHLAPLLSSTAFAPSGYSKASRHSPPEDTWRTRILVPTYAE